MLFTTFLPLSLLPLAFAAPAPTPAPETTPAPERPSAVPLGYTWSPAPDQTWTLLLPGGPLNGTVVNYDQLKEIEALTLKRQADFTAMLINGSFTAGEQAKFEFPAAGDYWVCGQWNVLAFDTVLANYSPWIGASGVDVGYILEAKGENASFVPFISPTMSVNNKTLARWPAMGTEDCPAGNISLVLYDRTCLRFDMPLDKDKNCVWAASEKFQYKPWGTPLLRNVSDYDSPRTFPVPTLAPYGSASKHVSSVAMILGAAVAGLMVL